jgi:hypothetical protein
MGTFPRIERNLPGVDAVSILAYPVDNLMEIPNDLDGADYWILVQSPPAEEETEEAAEMETAPATSEESQNESETPAAPPSEDESGNDGEGSQEVYF